MAIQNAINLTTTGIVSADGSGAFTGRTVTGTSDFIDVANGDGTAGNPTLSIATNFEFTGMHGWNGSIVETTDVDVTSDGATITLSVQKSGGGNLTVIFSDGYDAWTTAPDTVTLTAGTDSSPQSNYIYFLKSTKTLTASTSAFPSAEHAPIATVICQSAASLQTDGAYKVHVWTDHVTQTTDQGHIADLNSWIRHQDATWVSGVLQTYTITPNGGAADNVILTTASGVVLQLHNHTFPAFSGTPDIYVVNDSVTPYTVVTDLNAILTDSTGSSMSGKYFSLIIWGAVSEDEADCKLFCNLPAGSYNNASSLTLDTDSFANFTIPSDFKGTAFLISQWNLRHQAAASGTWTSIDEIDLRGQIPSISQGGTNAFPSEFIDNVFRILDDGDNSRELAFECAGITTATTRTLTIPDASGTIALASGLAANGFAYALDGNTIDSTAAATNGQVLIGSTGLVPVAATITGGAGITVTNGAGTITLSSSEAEVAKVGVSNLGIKLSAGTFSIVSADGTDLTASNIGYVTLPAVATPGTLLTISVTDNHQFVDDSGTSTILGTLWGTTADIDWSDDMPFFIYAIMNDADDEVAFGISRSPAMRSSYATANIGASGTVVTTNQNTLFLLDLETGATTPTIAEYDTNPAILVGSFKMTKTGTTNNDWTVTTLDDDDGIGQFQWGTRWNVPTGVNGAASGTFFIDQGGTEAVFSTQQYTYTISREGIAHCRFEMNNVTTPGTGGTNIQPILPAPSLADAGSDSFYAVHSISSSSVREIYKATNNSSTVFFTAFYAAGSSSLATTALLASGDEFGMKYQYKPFD